MATNALQNAQPTSVALAPPGELERPASAGWRDYVTLTKPRVMSLLLLSTIAAMFAGARGMPGVGALLATLLGGAMASGGASAINHVVDRDIDRLMGERTKHRPIAEGRVSAERGLLFGCGLTAGAFLLLLLAVNALAAALALAGGVVYVFVYTLWLKRSTPQNIVIGGVAGAIPPLVGWAAATGTIAWPAIVMFAIVTLWTPPHFWALALMLRRHYADADVPMLPVVKGERATARQILGYSLALLPVSLLPAASPTFGVPYLCCAAALGVTLLALSAALVRSPSSANAARLFSYSLLYLALLFGALALTASL
ncbi:MAG: heme o synthase [Solirubrobacteraceae bacterium]